MHFKRQTWEKLKPKSATEEILDTQFCFSNFLEILPNSNLLVWNIRTSGVWTFIFEN